MNKSGLQIMLRLLGLLKSLVFIMLITILTGTIAFFAAIFMSVFGGYALLNILGYHTSMDNRTIFTYVIIFVLIVSVFRYIEQVSGHYIAFRLLAEFRDKIFASLRRLAPAKLDGKDKGNLISMITADIELLEVFYAHTIAPVSQAIISVILLTLFIGSFHPILGVIAFVGYCVVGVVIPYINTHFGRDYGREYRKEFGDMNTFVLESLRGLKEILQFGNEEKQRNEMENRSKILLKKQEKLKSRAGYAAGYTDVAILLFGCLVLFVGIYLRKEGLIGFDGVLVTTIAMLSSFGPVIAISLLANDLQHTLACGERVLGLLEEEPIVNEVIGKDEFNIQAYEGFHVDKVSFAYKDETVLDNVTMEMPKQKIIGIHGASGSGKSTLLKLLMRFYPVVNGNIELFNGKPRDINDINTKDLRELEGYVTQETYLFQDSLLENIRVGKLNATKEQVIEAAKKASIHDFIVSLPQGYDTKVSELGSSLSGGERQRIGLARAFLHDAPVLLLDEPTSNLDSLNEGIILKSLAEECKEKTVVLVSHRASTMNISDVVYHMDNSRLS